VGTVTSYDESIARYGSTWAGVHVSVNRFSDAECVVRSELPLGVRWFRVSSDPANMSASATGAPSTTAPTSNESSTSTTVAGAGSSIPTTSLPNSANTAPPAEPSLTSFVPATSIPVVDLDLAAQIIIEQNVTSIVITGESIEASARQLNVVTGFVRIRPNTGEWTRVSLPRPGDVKLALTTETSSLELRFEPLDGEPILVSVPLAIVVNDSRTWMFALLAFTAGSVVTYLWFVTVRRRRRSQLPPPSVA